MGFVLLLSFVIWKIPVTFPGFGAKVRERSEGRSLQRLFPYISLLIALLCVLRVNTFSELHPTTRLVSRSWSRGSPSAPQASLLRVPCSLFHESTTSPIRGTPNLRKSEESGLRCGTASRGGPQRTGRLWRQVRASGETHPGSPRRVGGT